MYIYIYICISMFVDIYTLKLTHTQEYVHTYMHT